MRPERCIFIAILVLLAVLPLRGDEWEELRNRPGNDDVFVMVDTSLSMAPSHGGALSNVKVFLQDLFARYVKDGDRIILMTFDANAHVRSIVPIVERKRDIELLRDVIDGIDARRVVHYTGTYPHLVESRDGPLIGGGAWTDYCEMWQLSARVIQKYSDPARRQLFLLFTDGKPDAPSYRQCNDPGVLSVFSSGLREDRFRMGVVALPSGSGSADELSARLSELLRRMPGYQEIQKSSLRVIDFRKDGQRIDDGLRRDILDLISSRVDLVKPKALHLGAHYTVNLDVPLTVVNRSKVRRAVSIRNATLYLDSGEKPIPITVTPSTVTLLPGQSGTLSLRRPDLLQEPGEYKGKLVFNFATASHFDPAVLTFSAKKQTWLEAYGQYATWTAVALVVILTLVVLWLTFENTLIYAPAKVTGQFRGDPYARPDRNLAVAGGAAFGGGGMVPGELYVNADAPAGTLLRSDANEWKLSWDGASYEPYLPGMPASPPGSGDENAWLFFVETNHNRTLAGIPAWLRSKFRWRSRP